VVQLLKAAAEALVNNLLLLFHIEVVFMRNLRCLYFILRLHQQARKNMLVGLGFGLGGLLDGAQLLLLFEFQHHELLEVLGGVRGQALL
tara:strand:- start:845 stop:1111 length:267 start_codon:yes stop_codon:yes gene_type:complete